jgi:hypothetical protein
MNDNDDVKEIMIAKNLQKNLHLSTLKNVLDPKSNNS